MFAANNSAPNLLHILNSIAYDADIKPPQPDVLLKVYGENIGSAGNYITLTGLPKSGKSSFLFHMISSMIYGVGHFGIYSDKVKKWIDYFDTESSRADFYTNIETIKRISGTNKLPSNFAAYNTREYEPALTRQLIEYEIEDKRPKVLIIDGLLDIINNYNDERESREVVTWLKRLTLQYNMLLIGVIHTGKKDNFSLGHYGSMLDRYAQSVLEVTKDNASGTMSLVCKYARSSSGFSDIHIKRTGANFYETEAPNKPKK